MNQIILVCPCGKYNLKARSTYKNKCEYINHLKVCEKNKSVTNFKPTQYKPKNSKEKLVL